MGDLATITRQRKAARANQEKPVDDKELKVTDKRMFTPDGELREEFRHLERKGAAGEEPAATAEAAEAQAEPAAGTAAEARPDPDVGTSPPPVDRPSAGHSASAAEAAAGAPRGDAPPLEIPGTPEGLGAPTFMDLVTLLAEPIALYMGDVEMPDGQSAENLDMARLHIDLLDVLRRKTAGNLEAGEARLLEDLLYRCRLRYVQKRG